MMYMNYDVIRCLHRFSLGQFLGLVGNLFFHGAVLLIREISFEGPPIIAMLRLDLFSHAAHLLDDRIRLYRRSSMSSSGVHIIGVSICIR